MSIFKKSKKKEKYIDFTTVDRKALLFSFIGPKNGENKNLKGTNRTVVYMTRPDTGTAFSPWIEQWEKSLGDLPTPHAPWLGFKITAIINERLFIASSNNLIELEPSEGNIKNKFPTGNTILNYILSTRDNQQLIVLNSYYKFSHESNKSNLACYHPDGREIWRVQLPIKGDFITGVWYKDKLLTAYSWNGYNHKVNPHDGSIIESKFTK